MSDLHQFPEGADPLESFTTLRTRVHVQRREIERLSRDLAMARVEAHMADRVCDLMREAVPHVYAGAVAQVMSDANMTVRRAGGDPPAPLFKPRIVPVSANLDGNPG